MYIVYIVKIFEITLHFSEKMTKKKNKKSESAIMLLKIFEVYGGFDMFAFILTIFKFIFKLFLIGVCILLLVLVQWDAHSPY